VNHKLSDTLIHTSISSTIKKHSAVARTTLTLFIKHQFLSSNQAK